MGVRFPSVQSTTIVNATIITTAETVVVTSPPLTLPLDSAVVIILYNIQLGVGASTTSQSCKLRRGTTVAAPLVNLGFGPLVTTTAGGQLPGCYVDQPGPATSVQYSITVTCNAATGNTPVSDVCIIAFAL